MNYFKRIKQLISNRIVKNSVKIEIAKIDVQQNFTGKWLDYDHFIYHPNNPTEFLNLIHPEDRAIVLNNNGIRISECIGYEDNYLLLKTVPKSLILRCLPEDVKEVFPTPKFKPFTKVREVEHPEITGLIGDLLWHYKDNEFKYFLLINGKLKKRQYNGAELENL